jgi:hypothetical protein
MSKIDRVEIHAFSFEVGNMGLGTHPAAGVGNMVYMPGSGTGSIKYDFTQ